MNKPMPAHQMIADLKVENKRLKAELADAEVQKRAYYEETRELMIKLKAARERLEKAETLTASEAENARLRDLCIEAYELIRYEPSEPEEADLAQRLKQALKPPGESR